MGIRFETSRPREKLVQTYAYDGKCAIGSVFSEINGKTAFNFGLQVNASYRGQGIGTRMLNHHEGKLRRYGVKTIESELPNTYEKDGAIQFHNGRGDMEITNDGRTRRRI